MDVITSVFSWFSSKKFFSSGVKPESANGSNIDDSESDTEILKLVSEAKQREAALLVTLQRQNAFFKKHPIIKATAKKQASSQADSHEAALVDDLTAPIIGKPAVRKAVFSSRLNKLKHELSYTSAEVEATCENAHAIMAHKEQEMAKDSKTLKS